MTNSTRETRMRNNRIMIMNTGRLIHDYPFTVYNSNGSQQMKSFKYLKRLAVIENIIHMINLFFFL